MSSTISNTHESQHTSRNWSPGFIVHKSMDINSQFTFKTRSTSQHFHQISFLKNKSQIINWTPHSLKQGQLHQHFDHLDAQRHLITWISNAIGWTMKICLTNRSKPDKMAKIHFRTFQQHKTFWYTHLESLKKPQSRRKCEI